jgi:hypothetical protein
MNIHTLRRCQTNRYRDAKYARKRLMTALNRLNKCPSFRGKAAVIDSIIAADWGLAPLEENLRIDCIEMKKILYIETK